MSHQINKQLTLCEQHIGYVFQDKVLLRSALTHASGAEHRLASNERLEFLGDAILGMVVCQQLYHQFPEFLEGDLTKIKSTVVSRATCARISRELGLEECLIVGKGMKSSEMPTSLLSDVLESLVAAVLIDGGFAAASDFIARLFFKEIDSAVAGELEENFKSHLQQYAQRKYHTPPVYVLVDEWGPDHSKCFKIAALVNETQYSAAWGKNKKQAEQKAAENALAEMRGDSAPHTSDMP